MIARLLLTTALSSALVLTSPVIAFAQSPGYNWTGFYAGFGASGVYDNSSIDFAIDNGVAEHLPIPTLGAGFTIKGGYNQQAGNFVFGLEAENTVLAAPGKASNADFTASGNLEELLTLRAKLGVAADRMLFYATAGVGAGRAQFGTDSGYGNFGSLGNGVGSAQGIVYGPVGGIGIEYAANDKISIDAEATVYSMSSITDSGKYSTTNVYYTGTYHPAGATMTIGANFHF